MQKCGLKEPDIEESFTHSGGPGGQKVNKTATAVQLRHIPTGVTVKCSRTRRQAMNRFFARRQLCEQLERLNSDTTQELTPAEKRTRKIRKQKQRRKRRSPSKEQS
ncbi:peptide chain release factor family protein [Limihaloglobus sulfuriphilus]|nr:peptide chain release factor-like protein [Limihaloglobus sulfuriphilus]